MITVVLRRIATTGLAATAGIFAAASCAGDVVSLTPAADTGLLQNSPDNNLGGHTNFAAGVMANGAVSRALLEFNPAAAIPPGAVINAVTLTLTVTASAGGNPTFELHPMLVDWGEGAGLGQLGSPAGSGESTWNTRLTPGTLWGAPGGLAGTDFAAASSVSAVVGTGTLVFGSTPGLVAGLQDWVDHPVDDFGWMLLAQAEGAAGTARRFASREDAPGRGPVLTVDFTVVPEPGTAGILGLGVVVWGFWRRRGRESVLVEGRTDKAKGGV